MTKTNLIRSLARLFPVGIVTLCLAMFSPGNLAAQTPLVTNSPTDAIVLPPGERDPLEPFNRAMWSVNKALLADILKPSARVYRAAVPKPVRTGVGNMSYNILYPDRLINNALQGKWGGVRDETWRFLCNSTVGLAGFFDIASKSGVPKWNTGFGDTFGKWGWHPQLFLMLPLYGPSNDRDALGSAADWAAQPLIYFSPYDWGFRNPLDYTGPYSFFMYGAMYNNFSDSVDPAVRFAQAEMDPYAEIKYQQSVVRSLQKPSYASNGPRDASSLQTLSAVFFTYRNPEFFSQAKTRDVLIPTTGRKLKFTSWMQKKPAPVVYIVPGLGSSRISETAMGLAELAYRNGFSAVCISSPFHAEFMDAASSVALPAYLPVDGHDVHVALTEIDHKLNAVYPGLLRSRVLMGYSMGAFDTLYVAATAETNQNLIKFDRYLALDPPVRLLHGVSRLDQYYDAPLAWPAATRMADLKNTLLKVSTLLTRTNVSFEDRLPFSGVESQFLVGLTFRFVLRDIIYDTQRRNNMGVLRHPIKPARRDALYEEIMHYSYADYFSRFAVPYYERHGLDSSAAQKLDDAGDLRTYETPLHGNEKIRAIVNKNDFLLEQGDLDWLHSTFGPDHLTVFPDGGHLGNLSDTNVQAAIVRDLDDVVRAH